jgi:polar amino acid transport system permease protein
MNFDFAFAWRVLPDLLHALRITVFATLGGMAIALVLGMLWTVLRRSRRAWVSRPAAFVVQFVRNTPLLVQLYFLFYVLPEAGLRLPPLTCGILGLGLHYSAYLSEIYRAGIEGVPRGQWEAAAALNLGRRRTFFRIVLPQAIRPMLPVIGNCFVGMFKDTPLLAAITVVEVLQRAKIIGSETFRYLEPLTLVGLLFLALSLVSVRLIGRMETRHAH